VHHVTSPIGYNVRALLPYYCDIVNPEAGASERCDTLPSSITHRLPISVSGPSLAARHIARLLPQHQLRELVRQCGTVTELLFIIDMPTAISPSSTILGTDFWVLIEIPMRMMPEIPYRNRWAEGREGSNALYGLFRRFLARPS